MIIVYFLWSVLLELMICQIYVPARDPYKQSTFSFSSWQITQRFLNWFLEIAQKLESRTQPQYESKCFVMIVCMRVKQR